MSRNRKLITRVALEEVKEKIELGVPLQRIITKIPLDISRPALVALLSWDKMTEDHPAILDQLYPKWLDQYGDPVQSQPADARYKGFFPLTGGWVYHDVH